MNQILFSVKYIFGKPNDAFSVASFIGLMNDILNYFAKNKKFQFKVQAIHTLQRMMSSLAFYSPEKSLVGEEADLWKNVSNIHKTARKWATYPELTGGSLQLIATILSAAPPDYFNAHFEPFLQADVLGAKKLKLHAYEAILSLLRGKYDVDSLENAWGELYRPLQPGIKFSFLMRPKSELDPDVSVARLDLIADVLFLNRAAAIDFDCLDTCAEILVQMAAYRYYFRIN